MSFSENNLVWIDLEMTGLEPTTDLILEIATIVTDKDLNILAEGPVFAIHQSDDVLDNMDEWCRTVHGKSGLTQRCRESDVTLERAVKETIKFLEKYVPAGKSPMCGNSICQDRRFLHLHNIEMENFFHYRNLDVSTIKELALRWRPNLVTDYKKKGVHLALEDIRESIEELVRYRELFFRLDS